MVSPWLWPTPTLWYFFVACTVVVYERCVCYNERCMKCATHRGVILKVSKKLNPLSDVDRHQPLPRRRSTHPHTSLRCRAFIVTSKCREGIPLASQQIVSERGLGRIQTKSFWEAALSETHSSVVTPSKPRPRALCPARVDSKHIAALWLV